MAEQKTALISGASGQDGQYLTNHLLQLGYSVVGLTRNIHNFSDKIQNANLSYIETDYSQEHILNILQKHKPLEFYNLAGQTYVGKSWIIQDETWKASAMLPTNILNAINQMSGNKPRFFQASSSEIYAQSNLALTESSPIGPVNPYGCAKAYAHFMVSAFRQNYNLYCVNGVLFNHESPLRHDDFLSKKVVSIAFDIKEKIINKIHLGNLDIRRDWGFSGDYIKAMHLSLQADNPTDYNICSGKDYSVRELVDYVFSKLGLSYQDHLKINQSLVRNNERPLVLGSSEKAKRELNWEPEKSFEEMLDILIKHEKEKRKGSN
ncbi:GDP-mannose 4,6-dehydratase [Bacteriovoracaceae bacterium]|nr:GDP-mannose 4,6-dehydratase [Bacteriovoracaceae bacterium]